MSVFWTRCRQNCLCTPRVHFGDELQSYE